MITKRAIAGSRKLDLHKEKETSRTQYKTVPYRKQKGTDAKFCHVGRCRETRSYFSLNASRPFFLTLFFHLDTPETWIPGEICLGSSRSASICFNIDSKVGGTELNCIMRGRPVPVGDNSLIHKRLPLRDRMGEHEENGFSAYSQIEMEPQEPIKPPWTLSLPHVLVATIASFLSGYHLGVVNAPLEYIASDLGFSGNVIAEGLVVSMFLFGSFVGCMLSGWLADGLGRRRGLQVTAVPMIVGSFVSAMSPNSLVMLLGRFIVGIGVGAAGPVTSMYVTEVSPAYVRGTYGSFVQIATCIGILGAFFIGIPAKSITGWWRACFWVAGIPAAFLALGMEFCSESPQWLIKQSRWAEAEYEVEKIWGGANLKFAMAEISRLDKGDEVEDISFMELLNKKHRKVVSVGAILFLLQQLSGINAIFYFSSTVFKSAGIHPDLANISVGVVNLIASVIATILMDKLGRKNLLLWSFFGMAMAMLIQAIGGTIIGSENGRTFLSVGGTLLFVFTFSTGAGPVPALLLPEIFSSRIRAKGLAFCMCVHWASNCFVGLMFLQFLLLFGAQILYTFFAVICLTAVIFIKRNVIETKGKSLEEIEIALLSDH